MWALGVILVAGGIISFIVPGFNGILFERSNVSAGDGQIIGAILVVGGLILIAIDKMRTKPRPPA